MSHPYPRRKKERHNLVSKSSIYFEETVRIFVKKKQSELVKQSLICQKDIRGRKRGREGDRKRERKRNTNFSRVYIL